MVDLEKEKLFTNAAIILRDFLIANITDPKGRFKTSIIRSSRQFPSAVDGKGEGDWPVYPYLVYQPFSIQYEMPSNGRTLSNVIGTTKIEVLADVVTDMDKISSQIAELLNNNTHRETLAAQGFELIMFPTAGPVEQDFIEGDEVFIREFNFRFKTRMVIA